MPSERIIGPTDVDPDPAHRLTPFKEPDNSCPLNPRNNDRAHGCASDAARLAPRLGPDPGLLPLAYWRLRRPGVRFEPRPRHLRRFVLDRPPE